MKRIVACLLICLLLVPGMFIYVSAGNESIFTYNDSKAYIPNVILMTFRYNFDGIYPSNGWGSGAFGDVDPLIQNLKLVDQYDAVENGTNFTYKIYQLTLVEMYQHDDLINLAAHLADVVRSVEPVNFPYCVPPRSISLVEKSVEVGDYDDGYITEDNGAISVYVDHDYVVRDYPWSVEDFPELDIKSVQADRGVFNVHVQLKLNDTSKETLIDAAQKLAKRYEFTHISYITWNGVVPVNPIPPDDTTISADTTAPVADVQTSDSAPATSIEETTASSAVEKPTSPQTGDAGKYAACVFAAALLGVAGVVIYRKRHAS